MQVDAIARAGNQVDRMLSLRYAPLIENTDSIKTYIDDSIRTWSREVQRKFDVEFPFFSSEAGLNLLKEMLNKGDLERDQYADAVASYSAFCGTVKIPCDRDFWEHEGMGPDPKKRKTTGGLSDSLNISGQLLRSEWEKSLDRARNEWELNQLAQLRQDLQIKLTEILDIIERLNTSLEALGLDPGVWFDLSKGEFSEADIQQFQRWANYLAQDEGVKSLCDLLGKIRQMELSERLERGKFFRDVEIRLPDIHSREEIIGVKLGRDLEHVLPGELALLSDPETALLFDLKYVESRLMSFEMQGMQAQLIQEEIEEDSHIQDVAKQGPMIICIDTSGSMHGAPETIAKAISLYMATKAKEQKRACYLISFSTDIETLELTADNGMSTLLDFLRKSFHGGTDVAPAISHALDVMVEENYEKADLLIVSDFIMADLPDNMLARIEAQRSNGNKFYSLVVDSCFMERRLNTIFDQEWVYNPQTSGIHELMNFKKKIMPR